MYMEDCIQFNKFQKLHYRGNVAIRSTGSRGDVFVVRTSKPVENL